MEVPLCLSGIAWRHRPVPRSRPFADGRLPVALHCRIPGSGRSSCPVAKPASVSAMRDKAAVCRRAILATVPLRAGCRHALRRGGAAAIRKGRSYKICELNANLLEPLYKVCVGNMAKYRLHIPPRNFPLAQKVTVCPNSIPIALCQANRSTMDQKAMNLQPSRQSTVINLVICDSPSIRRNLRDRISQKITWRMALP